MAKPSDKGFLFSLVNTGRARATKGAWPPQFGDKAVGQRVSLVNTGRARAGGSSRLSLVAMPLDKEFL